MLVSKEVEIYILNNNKKFLIDKGYDINADKISIKVEDLQTGSKSIVEVQCDICGGLKKISFYNYNKSIKNGGIYCCSSKCSNIKKKKTNTIRFGSEWASKNLHIKEKTKLTNLEKWGTLNGITPEKINEIKKNNIELFGVESKNQLEEVKEKTKKSNLQKWGVYYPIQLESIKEKVKNTNLERFGVENPMKCDEIKVKAENTKIERYGDPYFNNREKYSITCLNKWGKMFTQTDIYREKSKETSLKNWGVDHPFQSDLIKEKSKNTKLQKYGNEFYNNLEKIKMTNIEKFGSEYTLQNKDIRKKIEETNLDKFGVKNVIELESVKIKRLESILANNKKYVIETYSNLIGENYKIIDYISGDIKVEHRDHVFITRLGLIYDRLRYSSSCEICTVCNPIYSNSSSHELELYEWISRFEKTERRIRGLINNQEIDIYLPNRKIGLEFNGIYWHSELFKDKWYHLKKTKSCQKNNISLIHIFEDDWNKKKDIVKSIILNKLDSYDVRIFARNCEVRSISLKECKKFLNENHIQGYSRCKFKLGLFFQGNLISVMTLGERNINSFKEFELIRFCCKLNYKVIGGASKLLYFFIKENNFIGKIVSYSDNSIFDGKLYEILGFVKIHETNPNYFWVVDGIRNHRFKYNKKKLVSKMGCDSNKTESEIMRELGNYKIWSCGQTRWEKLVK